MSRNARGWSLVVIQGVLLVGLVLLPRRDLSPGWVVVGAALVLAGAALLVWAFQRLGNALTATPVPIEGAGLRTSGPYAWVRHPIYSALLLMVLGYLIACGSPWSWAWGVLIAAFFCGKSRWEDRLLADEYGAEWTQWSRATGALVPRLRGRRSR